MDILDGIAPVAERYDGYVLDLWGVVHDGKRPYAGVPEALAELKRRGKRIVFPTNAPRRSWFIAGMLSRWVHNGLSRLHGFDATLAQFFGNVVRYAVLVLVIVMVLGQFGVQTASVLAALGAAGPGRRAAPPGPRRRARLP